jgi:hypothetical protein
MIFDVSLLSYLWAIAIGANATLAVRLYSLRLHKRYPAFFAYLIFQTIRSLALVAFPLESFTFAYIFFYTQPVLWVFYVLVVLELYKLVLNDLPGIYSLGRWALYGALVIAVTISFLTLIPFWGKEESKLLFWVTTVERGVLTSVMLFLFLILLFLSRYPLQLNRNIIVHCVVYTIFFLGLSMTLLVRNVRGWEMMRSLNHVVEGISLACYGVWIVFLTQKGEERKVALHHHRSDPADERRLKEQLNSMNEMLLRAARK